MLALGEKAPDFTLLNQDGAEIRLSDYHGKKVILYFYPKDNTPGCTGLRVCPELCTVCGFEYCGHWNQQGFRFLSPEIC